MLWFAHHQSAGIKLPLGGYSAAHKKARWTAIISIAVYHQTAGWLALAFVLFAIVSGKFRQDAAAFCMLLILGLLGVAPPARLFTGFSSPSLFTVATVLVLSEGIVESGILTGMGKAIAKHTKNVKQQIAALTGATWLLSSFMNNVGAVGMTLPTARRMARRAGIAKAQFGYPIAAAAILGGGVTLIGTAPNLIVSSYRMQATGQPFRMFDFAPQGLALALGALLVWGACSVSKFEPFGEERLPGPEAEDQTLPELIEPSIPRTRKNTILVLAALLPAVFLTTVGILHPSIAFGLTVAFWIVTGIFPRKAAYQAISLRIVLFLGSMLSLSSVLEETGALAAVVEAVLPAVRGLSPFWLIASFVMLSGVFANILENAVAAVLLSPTGILLAQTGAVSVSSDALLMAVAAGASLGLVLPLHQASVLTMTTMNLDRRIFIRNGFAVALPAGLLAAAVITLVWT